jgi:hypothetical protein
MTCLDDRLAFDLFLPIQIENGLCSRENFNNFMVRFFSMLLSNYCYIYENDAVSAKESLWLSPVAIVWRIGPLFMLTDIRR